MAGRPLYKMKKVRLVLVEGKWERVSFKPYLNRILRDADSIVALWTTSGDLTTRYGDASKSEESPEAIVDKVMSCVDAYMNHYKIEDRSWIIEIIHIVDTDAAYVSDRRLIQVDRRLLGQDPSAAPFTALDLDGKAVKCRTREGAKSRNAMKRKNLNYLVDCGEIEGIPYRVFFMSSELEHVLHNAPNVDDSEKREYAQDFECRFAYDLPGFVKFFTESDFSVPGSYRETWDYLRDEDFDMRSMERHTNLGLLFSPGSSQQPKAV